MTIFIYALQDPITQEIRYIGKTKNPKMRFHNHMNRKHNEKTHKRNWIESLKKQNLKPIMLIIDEVSELDWKIWERYWISQFKAWGFDLVNHTAGGEGSIQGNQTSFKKGQNGWNKGTLVLYDYICKQCGKEFKDRNRHRVYCSKKCTAMYKKNKTYPARIGYIPWNKGLIGGVTDKAIPVEQYDLLGNFINTFRCCSEAALSVNCIPENIRRNCVGKSKTARGFIWKYKKIE